MGKLNRRKFIGSLASATVAAEGGVSATPVSGQVLGRLKTGGSPYKSLATADYHENMKAFGGALATPPSRLFQSVNSATPWQFDVAVIGSGYGAAITAARLSQRLRPGGRLCVLERGREWVPGTFPDVLRDVMDEARLNIFGPKKRSVNNPTGLFNVVQSDEISVVSGSGLGGSSLINASVAIKPDPDVFYQTQWPLALRDRAFLDPYFDRAAYELGARVEPIDWTNKMRSMRLAAEKLADHGCHFEAAALTVTRSFQGPHLPVLNRQGQIQRDCSDCGDCLTGCNVGAKNTLAYNYLPMARRCGAEFFTQTEVRWIEKCDGFYTIHFIHHIREEFGGHRPVEGTTTARVVVLGAGSIGSTEILLRSQDDCFEFSRQLGANWTGNGDALGFVRKSDCPTNVAGVSALEEDGPRIGPTIQSNVSYPMRPNLLDRVLIQEGAAPRSYANILGLLMLDTDLDHSLVMLGMGHDGQQGRIILEDNDNGMVVWPGLLDGDYRRRIRKEFARIAHFHGGKYKYLRLFGDRMVSVHPLGGCGMSDDPRSGVINHKGQVYDCSLGGDIDPRTGKLRVHEGLYVSDGAVFPTAIGCNPHLTISAMAERTATLISCEPKYQDLFTEEPR